MLVMSGDPILVPRDHARCPMEDVQAQLRRYDLNMGTVIISRADVLPGDSLVFRANQGSFLELKIYWCQTCLLNLPITTEEVGVPVVMLDMCGVRRELRVLPEVLFELKRLGPGRGVLRDPDQRKKWTYCCQDNCSVFLA